MRPELERYQKIDLYLQNKLSVEEKAAFEKAMQEDSDLREEVEMQRMVNTVVLNAGYDDLKAKMSSDIQEIDNKAKTNKWKKRTAIGLFGLLIVASSIWLMQPEEESKIVVQKNKTEIVVESADSIREEVKKQSIEIKKRKVKLEEKVEATRSSETSNPVVETKKLESVQKEEQQKEEVLDSVVLKDKRELKTEEKVVVEQEQEKKTIGIEPVQKSQSEDLCQEVTIEITPMVDATCKEMPTGIIDLQNGISGGQFPYVITWKGSDNKSDLRKELSGGYHNLTIKDANGCMSEHQVFVPTENCVSTEAINPNNGEEWVYTNKKEKSFSIRIIGLSGREILRKENITEEFFIWQGKDRNGASLPAGVYAWVVEYSDGTRNTGQITIIR